MTTPDPTTAPDPTELLAPLSAEPVRFTLFAALRLLEQAYPDRPRLGEARKAGDDPVRLGQGPTLAFAPSDVSTFESGQPARLEQYSFGVFGPNGALPVHLTEQAYEWRRHREDSTLVDFLNVFQHRLISLFYRAWANADPATSLDRPDTDRFVTYIGALAGLAPESARNRDSVRDYAKLHRAGLFAPQVRSAEGLQQILADYFKLPVEVRQFVGDWMDVPTEAYCRLGGGESVAALGQTATLGASSWQCQHKFEIVLGPLTRAVFNDFLPGSRGVQELYDLVRLYTNDEWTWQLRLVLADVEVPGVWLGGQAQLGWTTWLGGRRTTVDDVVLQEPMLRLSNLNN
jgi:type VI secretion system protein ImpH